MRFFALSLAALLLWGIGDCNGYKRGVANTKYAQFANSLLEERAAEAVAIYRASGVDATLAYCGKAVKIQTAQSEVWSMCTMTAEFYDPRNDTVSVSGNTTTLPVAIYTQVRSSRPPNLKMRKVSINIFISRSETPHGAFLYKFVGV